MRPTTIPKAALVAILAIAMIGMPAGAEHGSPTRSVELMSATPGGVQGNSASNNPAITPDGQVVAFDTISSNLVAGDTNGRHDVYLRDMAAGVIERISISSSGGQASGFAWSYNPALSADAQIVAFEHLVFGGGTSLVPGDTNEEMDVLVRDRIAGTTVRVSVATNGSEGNGRSAAPAISADGRYVAFQSTSSNFAPNDDNSGPGFEDGLDVFVHDRVTGTTELVSVGMDGTTANGISATPSISADGRYVAFFSSAPDIVPGDTNDASDIFLRDRQTGTTSIVSVATDGTVGNGASYKPAISADGTTVAWYDESTNLVAGDTNGRIDVFVRDLASGTTERVSVATDGTQSGAGSLDPSLSSDGQYVTFQSSSAALAPEKTTGATDIFVHDRSTATTTLASLSFDGYQGNASSVDPVISGDGRYVAYTSQATNLVPGDTNGANDVFRHDRSIVVVNAGPLRALVADLHEDQVLLSGRLASVDAPLARNVDPVDDGVVPVGQAGLEITGASLSFRPLGGYVGGCWGFCPLPGTPDIFVRIGLLEHGVVLQTAFTHGLELTVNGVRHEIRGVRDDLRVALFPFQTTFTLHRCDPGCLKVADLAGAYTFPFTSSEEPFEGNGEIQVSLPLEVLGVGEGAELSALRAFAAVGRHETGALVAADEVALENTVVGGWAIDASLVPDGTPEESVPFDVPVTVSEDGALAASLDASGLTGEYRAWVRACSPASCTVASVPVRLA